MVQSSSIMLLKDFQDPLGSPPAGLAGSSLRLPSGLGSYEAFLKSNSGAGSGGRRVANLKALSGVIPKMQVLVDWRHDLSCDRCAFVVSVNMHQLAHGHARKWCRSAVLLCRVSR